MVQQQPTSISSFSSTRCDRCSKGHHKCDRKLPSCQRCTKIKKSCTYLNKSKNRRSLHHIEGYIHNFKPEQEDKHNKVSKIKNNNTISTYMNNIKLSIIKLPNGFAKPYTSIDILNAFPSRAVFENIINLVQYPFPLTLNSGSSLLLYLTQKFSSLSTKRKKADWPIVEKRKVLNLNIILNEALNHFFNIFNVRYPLFIRNQFNLFSKNQELIIAILLYGLDCMETNETTTYLIDYFQSELREKFKYPHKIPYTIQNIQSLFILVTGVSGFPWLQGLFWDLIFYFEKASLAVGLHVFNKNMSKLQSIERAMIYASISKVTSFVRLVSGNYLSIPYRPSYLKKEFEKLYLELLRNSTNQSFKSFDDFEYASSIILTSYFNNVGTILFALRLLKDKCSIPKYKDRSIIDSSLKLISTINKAKNTHFILIDRLSFLSQNSCNIIVQNYKRYILVYYHYLMFFLHSSMFYIYSQQYDNLNSTKCLKETLLDCQSMIEHASEIPARLFNNTITSMLSQCLLFITRYQHRSLLDLNPTIDIGLAYLKDISQVNLMSFYAKFNLNLIVVVKSKLKECNN